MRWIDVQDDLPPYDTDVLVCYVWNYKTHVTNAKFNPGTGWSTEANVLYWTSMPPLPAQVALSRDMDV